MATPAPTSDILEGQCSTNNAYFWGYFGGSVLLSIFILYFRYKIQTPPKYTPGATHDFGRPYAIGILLYHICMWNLSPPAAFFFLFHVLSTSLIPMQEQAACLGLASLPFIPMFIALQATLIVYAYKTTALKEDIGSVVNPEATSSAAEGEKATHNVLILGVTGRGALAVDAWEKEKKRLTACTTSVVDFAHTTAGAFTKYNAQVSEVEDLFATRMFYSLWKGKNKFLLPFQDHEFDRVIVTPFIRSAPPVGEFLTSDDTKVPRMVRMLREAMRVLKPGGEIFCYDQAANAIALYADLRDAGFTATIVDPYVKAGPIFFMQTAMLKVHCPHQEIPSEVASGTPLASTAGSTNTPLLDDDTSASVDIVGDDGARIPGERSATIRASPNTLYLVTIVLQLSTFLALCFASAAAYQPLAVPTDIPLSARVGNIVVSVATNYPLMAYFSRDATLNSDDAPHTVPGLIHRLLFTESLALLGTLLLTALLSVPSFAMELALTGTSLSDDTKSLIGMGISVFLGILMYKRGRAASTAKMLKSRNIPEQYHHYLL